MPASTFNTADVDTLDEVFLTDDEGYQHGNNLHDGSRHQERPIRAVFALEKSYEDWNGHEVFAEGNNQRPHVSTPGTHECEDCQRCQGGPAQREHNPPIDPPSAGTVDAGSLFVILLKRHEKLTKQEGAISTEHPRDNQCEIAIEP